MACPKCNHATEESSGRLSHNPHMIVFFNNCLTCGWSNLQEQIDAIRIKYPIDSDEAITSFGGDKIIDG